MGETTFPYPAQQNKSKKTKLLVIVGAIILALVVVGFIIASRPKDTDEKKDTTTTPTEEPSPTEKPKIEKTEVTIQVLNGTGTPGQAGTAVKALEEAGYSTDNIKSDNAEE